MIMSQEQEILKAQAQFDQIAELVRRSTRDGRRIDEVEGDLWRSLLQMGLTLLEGFVEGHGDGDVGATLDHQGRALNRLGALHGRRYVSVFGELIIERYVYGTRETQKHEVVPLDAVLGLPESDSSYLLQEWDQSFCVQNSYESSRQSVEQILGLGQSVRGLEQMNASMAAEVSSFRASQPRPPAGEEGRILVVTADCKGVPMRRGQSQDPPAKRGRRKKGEKANKKQMACVGAAYTIDPFERTAQDVVDEVMRDARKADRPAPQHKRVRAELTRRIDGIEVNGKSLIFSWLQAQEKQRNPKHRKPVVCVMDGESVLWSLLKQYLPMAVGILDIFHVMERLWQAAYCFHPEGSDEAKTFVTDRLERLLEGGVGRVIGGLRQMGTKNKLPRSKQKKLDEVIGYFHNNRKHMLYDEYLSAGYPIGSGVAEGACRHLVKDRMELTGMRWCVQGAQAMLDLRAVFINDDWREFQDHRIEQEQRKLYPDIKMIKKKLRRAA
jgi:hypothetical protein